MKTLSEAFHKKLSGTLIGDTYWGDLIVRRKRQGIMITKPYTCHKCGHSTDDPYHSFDCTATNHNESIISHYLRG